MSKDSNQETDGQEILLNARAFLDGNTIRRNAMLQEGKSDSRRDCIAAAMVHDGIVGLSDMANSFSVDEDLVAGVIADAFVRTHRTLQQSSTSILIKALRLIYSKGGRDPRNEAAMRWMREATNLESAAPGGRFPCI